MGPRFDLEKNEVLLVIFPLNLENADQIPMNLSYVRMDLIIVSGTLIDTRTHFEILRRTPHNWTTLIVRLLKHYANANIRRTHLLD